MKYSLLAHPRLNRHFCRLLVATALVSGTGSLAFAANGADTWNTTPGSALWSASGNWATGSTNKPPISGDSLVFGASTVTTLTDDLMTPGTFNIAGITFSAGAPSYTINSSTPGTNGFTLTGGITNSGTNLETINDAIAITASRTITMTTGGGKPYAWRKYQWNGWPVDHGGDGNLDPFRQQHLHGRCVDQ